MKGPTADSRVASHQRSRVLAACALMAVNAWLIAPDLALAQDAARPQPLPASQPVVLEQPSSPPGPTSPAPATRSGAPGDGSATEPAAAPDTHVPDAPAAANGAVQGRRAVAAGKVKLAFDNADLNQFIPWIVENTGKIVIPLTTSGGVLNQKKITLINDEFIERSEALDMLFRAFRLNGIGIVERDDIIIIFAIDTDIATIGSVPVLGPDVDVLSRREGGTVIIKIYRLKYRAADEVTDQVNASKSMPGWAALSPDINSSQIILLGDIDLAQHVQRLIDKLDVQPGNVLIRTFKLKHADANSIKQNVLDLFESSSQSGGAGSQRDAARRAQEAARRAQQGQTGGTGGSAGPTVELKVTTLPQQNALTISGDPGTVEQISDLIENYWDKPLSPKAVKVYNLEHTDPLKVQESLQGLLEGTSSQSSRTTTGGAARQPGGAGGAGAATSAEQMLHGIFQFQAYPDYKRLIVIAKTEESFQYLDRLIEQIDTPMIPNLPVIVPLKHAEAGDITELLNALLAESGAGGTGIRAPQQGLSSAASGGLGESPVGGSSGTTGSTGAAGTTGGTGSTSADRIELPWLRTRPREQSQSEPSSLIGKVRIVPVFRQNAVAVLAPPEIRDAVRSLISNDFDKPGRQVMISAIIAEVELTDELALGLRLSSGALTSNVTDNSLSGTISTEGTQDDIFSNLFTTSTLNVNADLNVLIQALDQKTNVRILQEPRVFTSDNQEAVFFDGQDIPFITDSQTTDTGTITQTTDYKPVGVKLGARPRITDGKDVDMQINLVISSVVPGQTLFGAAILNRRETSSRLIVKNGQTIVLSGILKEEENKITRGIPFLSDIPLLGEIFKSRENSTRRTELVAFITPIVVENPSENDENFNRGERERLRDLARPIDEQLKDPGAKDAIRERIVPPRGAFPAESTEDPTMSPLAPTP